MVIYIQTNIETGRRRILYFLTIFGTYQIIGNNKNLLHKK